MMRTLVPHMAALAVVAGCGALTAWQLDRAAEKRQLLENWHREQPVAVSNLQQPPELPQPVKGVGFFDSERQIVLDNKIRDGRPGVHVLTPWRTPVGEMFLVNRGWAHWPSRDRALPDPDAPEGLVEIQGVLNQPPGVGLRLGDSPELEREQWPQLMTYFDYPSLAALLGSQLQPQVIQLDPEHRAHLTGEDWNIVTFGPDRHIGYAFTWASIALVVAGIWTVLTFRSLRRAKR